jgi:3-oxoacyl-[acyl-carrier-protein] synthase II
MNVEDLRQVMESQLALSRRLKARIRELEGEARAPLAVVGMALRLPGGLTTPEDYWTFLRGDVEVRSEIPGDRPGLRSVYDPRVGQPGCSYVRHAGFLDDVAAFDAQFFGISQREAEALDPQQRLLLEMAWEAMERAGIAVRRSERLSAGVFVGIMASEYGERRAGRTDKSGIDPYFGTGGGHCFAAGRVSYALGFSGPALSVDTACSSSLVALQLAAESLRRRECRYALVGGTNMLFSGDLMVSLCQSRALAPDGKSKTFTAAADGYGRGEGAGVVVLMRLDEAEREERPILAVLRGVAVNHDGASSGLTVPNGPAQREVIRAALDDAGVSPEEIGYVEAHGTGTALGDPIEVGAIDAILGSGAGERRTPLALGSVKTRLGHLEAAAGIAGIMKLVLSLRHGEIPAALGEADGPLNPMIPWHRMPIVVPRRAEAWPADFARRFAGISAFGLSGTNAHAVFEAYVPATVAAAEASLQPELVVLSARDVGSLQALARVVAPRLEEADGAVLASLAHTLRAGRTAFKHRIAVTGRTGAELAAALTRKASETAPSNGPHAAASARLLLGTGDDAFSGSVAALADAFPLLATAAEAAEKPEERLVRFLRHLGVRARITRDPASVATGTRLEWGGLLLPLLTEDASRAPAMLLDALAALYVAGADLRLDMLRAPGACFVTDLPTYPFRRERFWIDEPHAAWSAAEIVPANGDSEIAVQRLPDQVAMEQYLEAELRSVLRADGELDGTQSFLALGGDSFIAMLFKQGIEQRYAVDIPVELFTSEEPLAVLLARIGEHILEALAETVEERAA